MKEYWYRRILLMVLVFTVSVGGSYYLIEGKQEMLQQEVNADTENQLVLPGGMPVGIYMETAGVLVLGTEEMKGIDGTLYEPAAHVIQPGDYIVGMENTEISNKQQLVEEVNNLNHEDIVLKVRRNQEVIDVRLKAVQCGMEEYKLGIWVRDNAQGLGTLTYLCSDSSFGALGHGIHDTDTNQLLDIKKGVLYTTSIKDIQKGEQGLPGGLEGIIVYNNYNVLGSISTNSEAGIYGNLERMDVLFSEAKPVEVAKPEEIKEGEAVIRCAVSGIIEEYDIRITNIDKNAKEVNKTIEVEVTDPKLLSLTGGIIQGMSGSPILQNGKLVGAITHVFVNNPEKGYGIFAETMLEQ